MTVNQAVEYILEMFPEAGETLILKELDIAQKEFNSDTELVVSNQLLSGITSARSFVLPTGTIRVRRIDYFNSDGEILLNVPLIYRIEDGRIIFDHMYDTISAIPSDIANIGLRCIARPTTLVTGASFQIPEEFHNALVSKVIRRFHFRYPQLSRVFPDNSVVKMVNTAAADEAGREYESAIIKAKKFRNLEDSTPVNIQGYFFAGDAVPYTAAVPSVADGG